jgi:hypothetical protein
MPLRLPFLIRATALLCVAALAADPAFAQAPPGAGPPAVGVAKVEKRAVTEATEYVGRIQATDHVDIVARVTAFIEERAFTEAPRSGKAICFTGSSARPSRPTSMRNRRPSRSSKPCSAMPRSR